MLENSLACDAGGLTDINVPLPCEIVTKITVTRKMSTLVVVDAGKKKNAVAKTKTPMTAESRPVCSRTGGAAWRMDGMARVRRDSAMVSNETRKTTQRRPVRNRNAPLGAKDISVVIVKK